MGAIYEEVRIAFHAIWRRRWIALAVAWLICLAGWLVVSQIPNRYESAARVRVDINSVLQGDIGMTEAEQQRGIDRVRQSLGSAVNLEKVVRGTDLANTIANDRDVADRVASLQKDITITGLADNLVEIKAVASSPKLARAIVQKLIDIFVESNLAGTKAQTSQSVEFLDRQLAELQGKLQDADTRRSDFQSKYLGALSGTGSLEERVAAARSQVAAVEQDLVQANALVQAASTQLSATPANMPGMPAVAGPAQARLNLVAGQIAEARGRGFTEAHPDMIALRAQYAAAVAAARGEPVAGGGGSSNPSYLAARALLAERQATAHALQSKKAMIQGDLDRVQSLTQQNPEAAAEQDKIERDYKAMKDQYDKLLQTRQDVALRGDAQSQTSPVTFNVTDPPTFSAAPAKPNRPLLLTGVLVAGLLGGAGAAFGLAQLKTTYPTATRLEAASGLPVIGSIGEVVTVAQATLRAKRLRMFAGGAGALAFAYVALIGVEFLQRGLAA